MNRSIIDYLFTHALTTPNKVAYRFLIDGETESDVVTFLQLRDQVASVAGLIIQSGLAGQRVLLSFPFGIDFIYAFLGCLMAGAIPMPISLPRPNRPNGHLDHIARSSTPAAGLTLASVITTIIGKIGAESPLQSINWIATDTQATLPHGEGEIGNFRTSDTALIQFSSGSTTTPKGVVITHENILANQAMIQASFGHHTETQGVGWLPMYHDMGLIGNVLQCIYVGYTMTFISPISFIQKPIRWLRAISRYRGTSSGGPNFAYAHCVKRISDEDCDGINLQSWDLAFNGAEPIHASTLTEFEQRFSRLGFNKAAFYPCYGLAEGTLIVTGGQKGMGPTIINCDADEVRLNRIKTTSIESHNCIQLVSSGRSLTDRSIRIVDALTQTQVPDGEIGEIWISGASVASGYWTNEQMNRSQFSLTLKGETAHYYATGDLGTLIDGALFVTGRLKELIIIDGKNYYPHDIESTVRAVVPEFSAYSTVVFSVPKDASESAVVVQEIRRPPRTNEVVQWTQQVRSALSLHHDLGLGTLLLVSVGSIEKTSSGKLKRLNCRQRYIDGTLVGLTPVDAPVTEVLSHA